MHSSSRIPPQQATFNTTCWTAVLAAGSLDTEEGNQALSDLCQSYWYPLYVYVRARRFDSHEAKDITQDFFATVIRRNSISKADRTRGRFRTFLLASLKHYMSDHIAKAQAIKRGGKTPPFSLDMEGAESRFAELAVDDEDTDFLFDREWAFSIIEKAQESTRTEYKNQGDGKFFDDFKSYVWGEEAGTPAKEIARRFSMSEGAVRVAAHRLRKRFRENLRHHVAQTLDTNDDLESEIRYLLRIVAR